MAGKLSIVATPIGNLGDITYRAIETLKTADTILAEDTRTTTKLLRHYNIPHKELISFFEGNEEKRASEVLLAILGQDKQIALVSESGTPLISDPGYKLIREAISAGIKIETVPGPAALISALTVSGAPTNSFLFLGFLPKKDGNARKILIQTKDSLSDIEQLKTVIFYESPHRLIRSLQLVKAVFGEVSVVVARELTKIHEEVRRGSISKVIEYFNKVKPRGEFTIILSVEM